MEPKSRFETILSVGADWQRSMWPHFVPLIDTSLLTTTRSVEVARETLGFTTWPLLTSLQTLSSRVQLYNQQCLQAALALSDIHLAGQRGLWQAWWALWGTGTLEPVKAMPATPEEPVDMSPQAVDDHFEAQIARPASSHPQRALMTEIP